MRPTVLAALAAILSCTVPAVAQNAPPPPPAPPPYPAYPADGRPLMHQQVFESDVTGAGYADAIGPHSRMPDLPAATMTWRPAPGGVKCLRWNGGSYAPANC